MLMMMMIFYDRSKFKFCR